MIKRGNVEHHGMSGTRIYNSWRDMRHRCYCEYNRNYKHYGGRGISVCNEWNNSFLSFYKWSMNNGYSDSLTIDRIDVNGNYEPKNCRWSDKSTQNSNKRNVGRCEYIGVSLHSNGTIYITVIKKNGKRIFNYSNASKNKCAEMRNDFIISHNLDFPLNEIKAEYEDVRHHKNQYVFYAKCKETGEVIQRTLEKEIAEQLGTSKAFIWQCMNGKRSSKKYIFWKEKLDDIVS